MKLTRLIILIGWIKVHGITYISVKKLHGKLFEYFITHARIDRYHLMCYIVVHDKKQPSYEDEESSIGDRPNPKNATTEAL